MEEDSDYSDTQSPVSTSTQESKFCTQENTIDSTAEIEQTGEEEHTDELMGVLKLQPFHVLTCDTFLFTSFSCRIPLCWAV